MTFAPYDEGYKIKTVLTEVDFQKLLAGLLNCDWPNHVPSRCYCRTNLQACLFRIAPPISLFCQRNGWSACFLICVAGFHDMLSKICCNSFRKERRNLKGKKKKPHLSPWVAPLCVVPNTPEVFQIQHQPLVAYCLNTWHVQ